MGAPSRKQRRSQPALHGSSLCCAGQRRRHAEHHGRLLLRRSGGRGPRGCAAGLLHLLTSGHSVGRLPNRNGAGRGDGHLTSGHPVAGRAAQNTQTQAAIAGALLRARTRTCSQPTKSPRRWWRTVQPQTRTRRRPRASPPLLSYFRASRRPPCGQARSHGGGLGAALSGRRRWWPPGEQILGPTDVSLSNWTVRPSSGCSVVLATRTAGVSVHGYTLTLTANAWNIVRTYNLTPGRELLFACH